MSTAEPELGLGLVLEADRRQIRLFFPASEETRVYAADTAPVARVQFKPGDRVRTQAGITFQVEHLEDLGGLLHYHGGGQSARESELADTINLATADRRLLDGRPDPVEVFLLRRAAWTHRSRLQQHPAHGYLGARMDLIPHQLYIAQEVAERRRPRVLLSDEVGLGKTIEACLILHRLHLRGQSGRVLILVPEPLIHQWFVELYRRFNLTCAIYDEARCAAIQNAGEDPEKIPANPFLDEHLALGSTTLFSKYPERLRQALAADWGLVIMDEAHHLKWTPEEASPEYKIAEAFSRIARGLLLLTGTPEQFGLEGHFARLHLLDPERYRDFEIFRREAERYHEIADVVEAVVSGRTPGTQEKQKLKKLSAGSSAVAAWLESAGQTGPEAAAAREALIADLLDRHGAGRAVFRNTRAAIPGFPKRRVHPAPLALPAQNLDAPELVRLETALELGLVEKLPRKTLEKDPRVDWLVKLLKKHPEEKFLLICRYQKRAEALYEAVHARLNVAMTVFHEEQTILQRDRNAAWFSQPAPEGARLLICSEIGSEGRNFQFAHHLVLYDLPADPELLEQRIGRLDRIGQRETIHIHVPYFKGTGGEMLFRWYHEGIDAFSRPIQGGSLLLEAFLPRLRNLLEGPRGKTEKNKSGATTTLLDPEILERLVTDTAAFRQSLLEKFEKGRDRLLEWHSCRPERVAPLIDKIRALDASPELPGFLLAALDHFGVHVEPLDTQSWLLVPGHLMTDQLTVIPPEGKTITFDRKTALDRDDVEFMTWDHPLVASLTDLLLGSESGNAAFSELRSSENLAPGLFVEMLFLLEASCPSRFDPGRFFPATPLRVVLDLKGNPCGAGILEILDAAPAADAPKHALAGQAAALKTLLDRWKEKADGFAEQQAAECRRNALENVIRHLDKEQERLLALQHKHREMEHRGSDEELRWITEERQTLLHAITESRPRLDAVRLIRVV